MNSSYSDYISHTIIKPALDMDSNSSAGMMSSVSSVNMEPVRRGYVQSNKRTIDITDNNGRQYRVTVEDITK